ncbi:MAG: glycoside hydrolase TIM-barrel-like domain-containing protein [Parvularculaceae bacterium]
MTTLVITAASAAAAVAPQAASVGAFVAQTAAQTAAAFAGAQLARAIAGGRKRVRPRLDELQIQASTEGAPILRVYGRARVAGQVIWAANFKESFEETGSGKGNRSAASRQARYSVSFAVALCEGPIDRVGRVWADGKPVDLSGDTVRFYKGDEAQLPDSAIEAVEGAGAAPAFRGTAYAVFEDFALARFGNRIPQLQFEVFRSLRSADPTALENVTSAVNIIPAAGEFVYGTSPVQRQTGEGAAVSENVNNNLGQPDFLTALDAMEELLPNARAASLTVAWFGDDLRAGQAEIRPGVEVAEKTTLPQDWSVGGVARGGAHLMSTINGRPAFGGTPSDASVIEAIEELKSRGQFVLFYPFLLLDIPAGNMLTDPYTGAAGQPAYPWRGRMTVDPAPGAIGSADKTAAARAQIDALFGSAAPGDFSIAGSAVAYSGPAEWSLRRMILHYAHLCALAGGVDAFLIGAEMRGLTTIRDETGAFPAVAQYKQLAAEVRGVLGPTTKISYAADWTEYFGYQPTDGSGDVYFHLDPLWADPNIDFVGVDNYMPLADWRDGAGHLDALAGFRSIYDTNYLQSNIRGGEGYDWFYASDADRESQQRTTIADGAAGKPWVFRFKDFWNWWSNAHFDRPGGVEAASPTAWTPESKPIWFTETGCPALDKGANQPNVFFDPKSSESALPHFSDGRRDDFMQRRFLEAVYDFWSAGPANNPISLVYGAPMVDVSKIFAYAWDARPYPDFPNRDDLWGDAPNWEFGHWLNGRAGQLTLSSLVARISFESGFDGVDIGELAGAIPGYVLTEPMSARDAIEPLMDVFQFDAVETGGVVKFRPRGGAALFTIGADDLGADRDADLSYVRMQETELPVSARFSFIDAEGEYRSAVVETRLQTGRSSAHADLAAPMVLDTRMAQGAVESLLADSWLRRDAVSFRLPPSRIGVEPADVLSLDAGGVLESFQVTNVTYAEDIQIEARRTEPAIFQPARAANRRRIAPAAPSIPAPAGVFLDLPIAADTGAAPAPRFAAFADPWPGPVQVLKSAAGASPVLSGVVSDPAIIGELTAPLDPGPAARFDHANQIAVRLYGGALAGVPQADILAGANLAAIEAPSGGWELIQFQTATLFGDRQYMLGALLRGQSGTERLIGEIKPAGARFVLLSPAVAALEMSLNERGLPLDWSFGPQSRPPTDPAYATQSLSFQGLNLRPLSPVRPAAARIGSDIQFTWIRRTRIGGDQWDGGEVPLGENREAYRLDILNAGAVVRSIDTQAPTALYAFADQEADFGAGGPAGAIDVRLRQLSDAFGPGEAFEGSIPL